jgi:hypothetical protein
MNNRRAVPWDAKAIMYEALIASALDSATRAVEIGLTFQSGHVVLQGERGPRFDSGIP